MFNPSARTGFLTEEDLLAKRYASKTYVDYTVNNALQQAASQADIQAAVATASAIQEAALTQVVADQVTKDTSQDQQINLSLQAINQLQNNLADWDADQTAALAQAVANQAVKDTAQDTAITLLNAKPSFPSTWDSSVAYDVGNLVTFTPDGPPLTQTQYIQSDTFAGLIPKSYTSILEMGNAISFDINGQVIALKVWNADSAGISITVCFWKSEGAGTTGTLLAQGTINNAVVGWNTLPLSSAESVTAGTIYVVSHVVPPGRNYIYQSPLNEVRQVNHIAFIQTRYKIFSAGFPANNDPGSPDIGVDVVFEYISQGPVTTIYKAVNIPTVGISPSGNNDWTIRITGFTDNGSGYQSLKASVDGQPAIDAAQNAIISTLATTTALNQVVADQLTKDNAQDLLIQQLQNQIQGQSYPKIWDNTTAYQVNDVVFIQRPGPWITNTSYSQDDSFALSSSTPAASDMEYGSVIGFRSQGQIIGIRVWSADTNQGDILTTLWDFNGNIVDQCTITSPTVNAWNRASFSAPIVGLTGTSYTISYKVLTGTRYINSSPQESINTSMIIYIGGRKGPVGLVPTTNTISYNAIDIEFQTHGPSILNDIYRATNTPTVGSTPPNADWVLVDSNTFSDNGTDYLSMRENVSDLLKADPLKRKLDGFQASLATSMITSADTILSAFSKLSGNFNNFYEEFIYTTNFTGCFNISNVKFMIIRVGKSCTMTLQGGMADFDWGPTPPNPLPDPTTNLGATTLLPAHLRPANDVFGYCPVIGSDGKYATGVARISADGLYGMYIYYGIAAGGVDYIMRVSPFSLSWYLS